MCAKCVHDLEIFGNVGQNTFEKYFENTSENTFKKYFENTFPK